MATKNQASGTGPSLSQMSGPVYDPELGRFLSPDLLIQAPTNTQSYNRYTYVFNNPVSLIDPTGYKSESFDEEVIVTGHMPTSDTGNLDMMGLAGVMQMMTMTFEEMTDTMVVGLVQSSDGSMWKVTIDTTKLNGGSGSGDSKGGTSATANSSCEKNSTSCVGGEGVQEGQNTRQNISNGLTGAGGVTQIVAGVAACSTGLGCVAGVPLIVLGVSNIGEAGTGFAAPDGKGFNLTGAAIERGFDALGTENSADLAVKTNAVVNLTADLAGLNVPSLAKNGFKLFRHIPTDYVRAIDNATTSGLILQAGGTVNTTVNALDTGSN